LTAFECVVGFPISGLREINLLLNIRHQNVVQLNDIIVGRHLERSFKLLPV